MCTGQAQEVEDGGASVLFDYLFSNGCVGREGDPEYKKEKKKRGQTKHRPAGKFIVNVPFSFFFCLSGFFILSFQNEGKWFVSQNNFKNISGSVEQHADKDYDDDYKDGVGGGLG